MRQSRKLDHLKYSLSNIDGPSKTGFEDIHFVHNCLPEVDWNTLDISSKIANISLSHPIIINAITGGTEDVTAINAQLAEFARDTNSVMAVGSQYAAIEYPEVHKSYQIIRQVNPDGVVIANLGAYATPEDARKAVDMIGAAALQIHLNPAQELIMPEGDRNFCGYVKNIEKIIKTSEVPVIVKEVGCGIAKEQATVLLNLGVRAIDIGGAGGTNFMAIEANRAQLELSVDALSWGIPTAISALEVASVLPSDVDLIVSGGIRTPLDVIKSLAIGGKAVGIANYILQMIHLRGVSQSISWFYQFLEEIRQLMVLVGAQNVRDLSQAPIIISGYSREWLSQRGIDTKKYAVRSKHG